MRNFCHLCGAKYIKGESNPWKCPGCDNVFYANPCPTVDILLFNDKGEALLAKRGIEPAKGKYDFPGGFVDMGETFEQALAREAMEELNLSPKDYGEPIYITSRSATYAFSKEVREVLGITFAAKLLTDKPIVASDDVESVKFVAMSDLDQIDFSRDFFPPIIHKAHLVLGFNK